jgi:Xaa-Pro aminopeptidase
MESRKEKTERVLRLLDSWPEIDRTRRIPTSEFVERRRKVWQAIGSPPYQADVGFVFSDEHYSGDVPYLFGNTNVAIEQVAGAVGPDDLGRSGIIAGFEGVYVAGQRAGRGGAVVYPTESLQLADEIYPVEGFSLKDILNRIAGRQVRRIALLTPRQVIPAGLLAHLERIVGGPENVVDAQEPYQKIKNLKSDHEMALLRDASVGTALMVRAMLAVLEPGMLETEVAAYGEWAAKLWGLERYGFPTMVGSDEACVTLIGPCLNRPIQEGAFVHLGASGKRDGLTACCRRSLIATQDPSRVTAYQAFWRELVEEAFRVGFDHYVDIVRHNRPAKFQEQSLVDYFNSRTSEAVAQVAREYGEEWGQRVRQRLTEPGPLPPGLARLKPYTGTHNAGYTECQEFYGAITLESEEPLDRQVVTMLDVALRGRGNGWEDVVIPGFDFFVVEDTLGKFGDRVENLTGCYNASGRETPEPGKLPIRVQELVLA